MEFFQCKCFQKDIKEISKTCKNIKKLIKEHITDIIKSKLELQVNLFSAGNFTIYKSRMKDCNNKGSRGGFRIIWAFNKENKKILFIRIYHKSDLENILTDDLKEFLINCLKEGFFKF